MMNYDEFDQKRRQILLAQERAEEDFLADKKHYENFLNEFEGSFRQKTAQLEELENKALHYFRQMELEEDLLHQGMQYVNQVKEEVWWNYREEGEKLADYWDSCEQRNRKVMNQLEDQYEELRRKNYE